MSKPHLHASLPAEPNLRHLKDQARERLKSGEASSLAEALFQTARFYGFQSWPKLKSYILTGAMAENSMNGAIVGWAMDEASGDLLMSPDVKLNHIGVPGEARAVLDERGRFSFSDLPPGEYSVAVYEPGYVPKYYPLTLKPGEMIRDLQIPLILGGYVSGQVLDEEGLPPRRCWFTLLREGERKGRFGYINNSGDHNVAEDGTFCSPPLAPGKYLLRFSGMLRSTSSAPDTSDSDHRLMQTRCFDFIYPNAHYVKDAVEISVQMGLKVAELNIAIPPPVWYTVQGKVTGPLPVDSSHISVMFARDVGAVDQIGGWGGGPVQSDGSFEYMVQQGYYSVEICEFTPPESEGRTHLIRRLGKREITVANGDVSDLEIAVSI